MDEARRFIATCRTHANKGDVGAIAAMAVTLTACGGSGGDQDSVADLFIELSDAMGFELDEGRNIVGVDPKGPAARAGLKVGDRISELHYAAGNARLPVRLRFQRGEDAPKPLSYLPQQGSVKGRGWEVISGVPRERCAR